MPDMDDSADDKDSLSRDIMIQVVDEEGNATQHKWMDRKYIEGLHIHAVP